MSDCNKRLAYEAFSGQANFDTYYGSSGSLGSYGSLCMNLFTTKSELQSAVNEWSADAMEAALVGGSLTPLSTDGEERTL